MKIATVYLDTNVFKFSATQLLRLKPRKQILNWGGKSHEMIVHDMVYINPNDKIEHPDLKSEADLLPVVAELGKKGNL